MSETLSDSAFAVGAYALILHMKVEASGQPEVLKAINDVLATASPSLQRRGRQAYGQIMEHIADGL